MRILIDSSSLYSYIAYDGKVKEMLDHVIRTNEIYTTDYIIEEIKENLMSKVTVQNRDRVLEKLKDFKEMTTVLRSEQYIHLLPYALKRISPKDSPILACAMLPEIELLITSDSEFLDLGIDEIIILSPRDAYEKITNEKLLEGDE